MLQILSNPRAQGDLKSQIHERILLEKIMEADKFFDYTASSSETNRNYA